MDLSWQASCRDVRCHACRYANVAELVDALDLGSSGATRESSSLSLRTNHCVMPAQAGLAFFQVFPA